jgi:prepilin-type N-terminal cleavage/methylation domain-containing protein
MPRAVRRPRRRPHAFTLLELMLVLAIVAVVMTIVMPQFGDDTKLRLMAAAGLLRSDIEYAQVLTISHPGDPVLVHIDASQHKYWLAKVSSENTPIARPGDGEPYLVMFGEGRAATTGTITVNLTDLGGEMLKFNSLGGVLDPIASPIIKLEQDKKWIKVHVANTTGTLTEEHGEDP